MARSEPGPPSSVTVSARHTALRVAWEPPADDGGLEIEGYRISWRTGTEEFATPVAVAAAARSHDIGSLVNGTAYDVNVVAYNSAGDSTVASGAGTPAIGTATQAPVVSIVGRDRSLRVRWDPPADDGGADITGYEIQWKTGTGDFNTAVELGAGTRTHDITGLDPANEYTVRVTAVNEFGRGAATSVGMPRVPEPPSSPVNLRLDHAYRGFSVSWDPPPDDGGTDVTGYVLRWDDGLTMTREDVTGQSYELTGLDFERTYSVRVSAVNSEGEGAAAADAGHPGNPPGPPMQPRLFSEDTKLTITWRQNWARWHTLSRYPNRATHFLVEWKSGSQDYSTSRQARLEANQPSGHRIYDRDTTRYSHTIEGLANGTSYRVRITPYAGDFAGLPTEVPGGPVAIAAGAPTSLSLYSKLSDQEFLNLERGTHWVVQWQPLPGAQHYVVQHKLSTESDSEYHSKTVRDSSTQVSGIEPGVEHTVRVAAADSSGTPTGPFTTIARIPQTSAPPPENFTRTIGDGKVLLEWEHNALVGEGRPIAAYRLKIDDSGTVADLRPDELSYEMTGLPNGLRVDAIQVMALNAFGAARAGPGGAVTAVGLPSGVRELAAVAGDGSLSLSWLYPRRDGGANVTYRVRWKGPGEQYHSDRQLTVNGYETTITGLADGAEQTVEVATVNSAGTGTAVEIRATPSAASGVPAAPTEPAAEPSDSALLVSWTAPAGTVEVTGYRIQWKGPAEAYHTDREATVDATTTHYSITGLVNGDRYDIRVSATSSGGDGAAATVKRTPAAVPSMVREVVGTARTEHTVALSWLAPDDDGGAGIEYYRVVQEHGGTFDNTRCGFHRIDVVGFHTIIPLLPFHSLDISDIPGSQRPREPGDTIRWQIAAVNSAGAGAPVEISVTRR